MAPAAIGDLGTLIFTYGTLKRGFSNHGLLRDLIDSGDAAYLGDYQTAEKLPLVCGPYRVPFLLNLPGSGDRVWGELYAVSARTLARMDELEGTTRGHYERLPITLLRRGDGEEELMEVEAYYAHRSYAAELWKRSGEKGYSCYGEIESSGYIRRKDRPQHLSFLDQISLFIRHNPSDAAISNH
ncbi:PREDICTED: putative gamma-glutamylcyclotransferase At3g02910 [Ipomoea nil]|uniref:putative gamma-glutamylcyclotransferase At3g02910 n=1 Tax=Ipomoea nil TaxID=35883 RepID=UPI000901CBBD|nr:PREDICTED: putative gamma-glutamylcyclotransferase At3g02910 [Ipomoea nil]